MCRQQTTSNSAKRQGRKKNIQNKSTKYVRFHKFRLNIFAQMFYYIINENWNCVKYERKLINHIFSASAMSYAMPCRKHSRDKMWKRFYQWLVRLGLCVCWWKCKCMHVCVRKDWSILSQYSVASSSRSSSSSSSSSPPRPRRNHILWTPFFTIPVSEVAIPSINFN